MARARALTSNQCPPSGWQIQLVWYPVAHKFIGQGLQTAARVPLQCDKGTAFQSFRIGMFGLEKLHKVARTVQHLQRALDRIRA